MSSALRSTGSGSELVFEGSQRETKSWASLEDLGEKSSGVLGLEVVVAVEGSLEDGSLDFGFLGLTGAGRNDNIDSVDLVNLEFDISNLELEILLLCARRFLC